MQTSQTSLHQRRLEEFAVRVLVEEVRRVRGIVLVRGMVGGSEPLRGIVDGEGELKRGMFSGKEKKIILAEGERGGIVGEEVRKGNLIGIRAPVWEVDVLGESWGFGVQWQVIDS